MLLGLRTVVFKVTDLDRAKQWYSDTFGITPYFDEPFYVGFNVGGYELGLDPSSENWKPGSGGAVAYWGVQNLVETLDKLATANVTVAVPLQDVGDGIKAAVVRDPFGNDIGLMENPHFNLAK
jgi:predicted enzyme related to lactoylglutathione lyase